MNSWRGRWREEIWKISRQKCPNSAARYVTRRYQGRFGQFAVKKYLCKIVCKISLEPAVQNPVIRIAVRYKGSPHKMCREKSPGKIFAQTLYQIVFLARSLFSVQSNRTRALQEISWQDFCTRCVRFLTEIYKSDLCSSFVCKLSERDLLARSL